MTDKIKQQIQKTLLGHVVNDLKFVIITPISSAFKKLKLILECTEIYKNGFFDNTDFKTQNGISGLLVLIPQGVSSQDIMYAFSDTHIIFFGYAGSLCKDIAIGTILEIETARLPDGQSISLEVFNSYNSVVCGYSPCLLGEIAFKYCEKAFVEKCHIVDMEICYCAYAAKVNHNKFTAMVVVSDIPNTINFWELCKYNKENFKQASNQALEYIATYINSI